MKFEAKLVAVDCDAVRWAQAQSPHGPKQIFYRMILSGGDGLPQVHLSRYEPHWVEPRHRHVEDEVLMNVQSEITLENMVYRAPSVLFVGRHTLYGPLTAGDEGVSFYRVAYTEKMISRQAPEAAA